MSQIIEDRFFSPESMQRDIARRLYTLVKDLPLLCPHGHVDPVMLAAATYDWGSPVDLLIVPDHYVTRMLYSQGIALEDLGIATKKEREKGVHAARNPRQIWQAVCDHWYLFRGTPSSIWLRDELRDIFGIKDKLNSENAQSIYDAISQKLQSPEFQPRALFERFHIETLATTDAATDTLEHHQRLKDSGWNGRVIPTLRPDAVVNIQSEGYATNIQRLALVSGTDVVDYRSYIAALEQRRQFFKSMGATATDHAAFTAYTEQLSDQEADAIFQRALQGKASEDDARRFTGHMLIEMARMSVEDGLVMQVHIGSYRDHNPDLAARFGRDMGADIPIASEFTRNFKPLLDRYGCQRDLTLVVFNLDETVYSRELAPLAGHYPALRLGPPWWFFDSLNGIRRYFDTVIETAGIYNTAGFNDDTRAYPSIPARHDLWRRVSSDWLAGQVARGILDEDDAAEMVVDMAYRLAKQTYKLEAQ